MALWEMNQNLIWFAIVSSIVLLSGITGITIYQDVFAGQEDKVEVCHKGKTITVGAAAVPGHIGHGDEVGACNGGGLEGTLIECICGSGPDIFCAPPGLTCGATNELAFCSVSCAGGSGGSVSCSETSCPLP